MNYEDKFISIENNKITIKNYYFPIFTSKVIDAKDIKSINKQEISYFTGRLKLWGMNIRCMWFNLDMYRYKKTQAITIDIGNKIKPTITPDPQNYDTVYNALKQVANL